MNQRPIGFRHVTRGGLRFDRCPKAWVRDDAAGVSSFLDDFVYLDKHGIQPNHGGKLDQSPRFLQAVGIIEAAREGIRAAQERRDETGRKRGGRGN